YFLYMGFWNFCISIPLLLFALGYYWNRRGGWSAVSALVFAALVALTYGARMLSWAVLAMVVLIREAVELIATRRVSLLPSVPVSLPAALAFGYLGGSSGGLEGLHDPLRVRLWPLYSASSLRGLMPGSVLLSQLFVAFVAALALIAIVRRRGGWKSVPSDVFLLFAGAATALCIFGPSGMAQGAYVRERFALYAWMFFVAWLASQDWPRKIATAIAAAVCALATASAAARISAQQSWNRELREYTSVRQYVEPQSTILAIQLE